MKKILFSIIPALLISTAGFAQEGSYPELCGQLFDEALNAITSTSQECVRKEGELKYKCVNERYAQVQNTVNRLAGSDHYLAVKLNIPSVPANRGMPLISSCLRLCGPIFSSDCYNSACVRTEYRFLEIDLGRAKAEVCAQNRPTQQVDHAGSGGSSTNSVDSTSSPLVQGAW